MKNTDKRENKKDMKRIILLGMCVVCLLIGCGGSDENNKDEADNDKSIATESTQIMDNSEGVEEAAVSEETKIEEDVPEEVSDVEATNNNSADNQPVSHKILYDEEGYIILKYETKEKLKIFDKPNVHLTGTLVDTNNTCFTIEDEDGHIWTGQSAGGLDFTEYIGTQCDIYGFCSGGISSQYDTPLIDMAYDDSHISFSDGLSYYPNDNESYAQFPSWNFENEEKTEENGTLVWIPTDGGTKYHSYDGCSGMDNPEQVTESEAIERGYSRCGKCW